MVTWWMHQQKWTLLVDPTQQVSIKDAGLAQVRVRIVMC